MPKISLDTLKTIVEIVAYFAATVFFCVNLLTGALSSSLQISINAERKNISKTEDDIVVKVNLKRGKHGAIKILSAEVFSRDCSSGPIKLKGLDGLKVSDGKLNWNQDKGSPYVLTPEDSGVFSSILKVPQGQTCTIEVGILGNRPLSFYDVQWRSAIVVHGSK